MQEISPVIQDMINQNYTPSSESKCNLDIECGETGIQNNKMLLNTIVIVIIIFFVISKIGGK